MPNNGQRSGGGLEINCMAYNLKAGFDAVSNSLNNALYWHVKAVRPKVVACDKNVVV